MAINNKEIEISISLNKKIFEDNVKSVESAMKGLKDAADKASSGVTSFEKETKKAADSTSNLNDDLKNTNEELKKLPKSTADQAKSLNDLSGEFTAMGVGAGIAFTAMSASLGGFLNSAGKMEQWRISFETMLGSASQAKILLDDIKTFAATTPFELPGLIESSKQLLAFGVSAENIIPTMQTLGDISAGIGTDKLPALVSAFGKIQTKGKASLEELNMLLEAGVPIIDALSKNFNVSTQEMYKLITAGKVGFPEVEAALQSLTGEGGLFFNLMSRQSKSLFGVISNIKDNLGQLSIALGSELLPLAKTFANRIQEITASFLSMDPETRKFIITTGLIVTGLTGVITAVGLLGGALLKSIAVIMNFGTAFMTVLTKLNLAFLTSPIGLSILAIVAAIGILYTVGGKDLKNIGNDFKDLTNIFKIGGKVIVDIFQGIWEAISDFFSRIGKVLDKFGSLVRNTANKAGIDISGLSNSWSRSSKKIGEGFDKIGDKTKDYIKNVGFFGDSFTGLKALWEKNAAEMAKATLASNSTQADSNEMLMDSHVKMREAHLKNIDEIKKANDELVSNSKETAKALEETNRRSFEMGILMTKDFQGTVNTMIDKMFTDPEAGIGKQIRDYLSILGAESGGYLGGVIAASTSEALTGLFGEYGQLKEDASALAKIGSGAAGAIGMAIGGPIGAAIGQTAFNLAANYSGQVFDAIKAGFEWFADAFGELMRVIFAPITFVFDKLLSAINFLSDGIKAVVSAISSILNIANPLNIIGDIPIVGDIVKKIPIIGGFFASGTPDVPNDMLANIHEGEIIVPSTFSEAIRNGELSLSGSSNGTNSMEKNRNITNNITINAGGMDPETLALRLKPYLTGTTLNNKYTNYNGVFA